MVTHYKNKHTYLGVGMQPPKKFRQAFEQFIFSENKILIWYYFVAYLFIHQIVSLVNFKKITLNMIVL